MFYLPRFVNYAKVKAPKSFKAEDGWSFYG